MSPTSAHSSTFKKYCHHLLRSAFLLLCTQFLSILLTLTGVFTTKIQETLPIPILQTNILYLSLFLVYTPIWVGILWTERRMQWKRWRRDHSRRTNADGPLPLARLESSQEDEKILSGTYGSAALSKPPTLLGSLQFSTFLAYFIQAVFDVVANFLVAKAYQYTTITSVQLLDCFTIPCALLLSVIFLRVRYRVGHWVGVILCLIGIISLILGDIFLSDATLGNGWKGDVLAIVGAMCYAVSNVLEEGMMKKKEHIETFLREKVFARCRSWACIGFRALRPSRSQNDSTVGDLYTDDGATPSSMEDIASSSEYDLEGAIGGNSTPRAAIQIFQDESSTPVTSPAETLLQEKSPLQSARTIVELLAFVGLFGFINNGILVLIFELNELRALSSFSWHIIGHVLGYDLVMFVFYTAVPIFLTFSSATFLNLSFLTSDIYSVLVSIFLIRIIPHFMYYVSFFIIVTGLVIYNLQKETAKKEATRENELQEEEPALFPQGDSGESAPDYNTQKQEPQLMQRDHV